MDLEGSQRALGTLICRKGERLGLKVGLACSPLLVIDPRGTASSMRPRDMTNSAARHTAARPSDGRRVVPCREGAWRTLKKDRRLAPSLCV